MPSRKPSKSMHACTRGSAHAPAAAVPPIEWPTAVIRARSIAKPRTRVVAARSSIVVGAHDPIADVRDPDIRMIDHRDDVTSSDEMRCELGIVEPREAGAGRQR